MSYTNKLQSFKNEFYRKEMEQLKQTHNRLHRTKHCTEHHHVSYHLITSELLQILTLTFRLILSTHTMDLKCSKTCKK